MITFRRVASICAVGSLAIGGLAVPASADEPDRAVRFADADVAIAELAPATVTAIDRAVQWRAADIDADGLIATLGSAPSKIELFDDATLDVGTGRFSRGVAGGVVVTAGSGLDSVTMTVDGDEVRGSGLVDGRPFTITPTGDGTHVIVEEGDLDVHLAEPRPVPTDADRADLPTGRALVEAQAMIAAGTAAPSAPTRTAAADGDGNAIVRVLTVYSNDARAVYRNDADAVSQIAAVVDNANVVLENSGIAMRVESAGIAHLDYDDGVDVFADLDALTDAETEALFDVHVARELNDADVVMMVVGPAGGTCGLAWLLEQPWSPFDDEYAFGVIDTNCAAAPQYGYIHEVGHIFGAGHGEPAEGVFPFSAGFRNTETADPYRTIMAYEGSGCPCPRVPYFSAPRTIGGIGPIGSANHDNAKTLNDTAALVAGFRPLPLVPTGPSRLLETRGGNNTTIDGRFEGDGARAAGTFIELQVAGRPGIPADAAAAMLNVTAIAPDRAGHITVWPCDPERPTASNLNYVLDQVVANSVLAKLNASGRVCIYTHARMHLVVDVTAYLPDDSALRTLLPARLLETRGGTNTTVDGVYEGQGPRPARSQITLEVAGRGGVPPDAVAAMLNVTAIAPDGAGHITVWPCDGDPPVASNLNYTTGQVVPNAVFAPLNADGNVCIYTHASTHLVVDVSGALAPGSRIFTVPPARLLETRQGPNNVTVDGAQQGFGPIGPPAMWRPVPLWRGGVSADAELAILNVTAIAPDRPGHLTIWPCDGEPPVASNVNYVAGQVVANLAIAEISNSDDFASHACVYSFGRSDVVIDVVAYM